MDKARPKVIIDQDGYFPKEDMPCEKCGAAVKLVKSYFNVKNYSVCPQCGFEYEYYHIEPPFDAGPDEWA